MLAAGCDKKDEYTFVPTHPVVTWDELSRSGAAEVEDGYRVLVNAPTQGVFPASVAVARLAARRTNGAGRSLALDTKPEVDFLAWNSCFDDFRFVSEVFPVNTMAMNGQAISVATVLSNARAMRAGLLMTYAEEQLVPERYEIRGVLYQVGTQAPLAALHAVAFIQQPVEPDEHHRSRESIEHVEQNDPRITARRTFERYARECLLALAANDQPAERVAPEGWIPDRPMEPILWPPVDDWRQRYEYRNQD